VFRNAGGTIGRGESNDWVLGDPSQQVSRYHAEIVFKNGAFWIKDDSANGTFVNGSDEQNCLTKGETHRIADQDYFVIGPYRVEASIEEESRPEPVRRESRPVYAEPDNLGGDPINLMGGKPARHTPVSPRDLDRGLSFENEQVALPKPAPAVNSSPSAVPPKDDYFDPSISVIKPSRSAPSPSLAPPSTPASPPAPVQEPSVASEPVASVPLRAQAPAVGVDDGIRAMLAALGASNAKVTPELVATLADVFRTVIEGLIDFFEERHEFKNALGIEQTQFRARTVAPVNNPLKFSTTCEEAVDRLFVKKPAGYMGPVESFDDVFEDLRNHHRALTVAMRVAFDAVLKAFDPAVLEKWFETRASGALLSKPLNLRYWELYRERFNDMANSPDGQTFNRIFSERFAAAYQAELDRSKAVLRDR
jgi:type VI secretion system FHA domain protein